MNQKTLLLALAAVVVAASAPAQIAFDRGSNAPYGTGWTVGTNGGYGFGPWTTAGTAAPSATATIVNVPALGGSSFTLTTDQGGFNYAGAVRQFNSPLGIGNRFSFDFLQRDPTVANGDSSFGFLMRNAANQEVGSVFGFFYNQFNVTPDYNLFIGRSGSNVSTGLDFRNAGGYHVDFLIASATTFTTTITALNGSGSFTSTETVKNAGPVTNLSFNNYQAGAAGSTSFNNLRVVPEPATFAVLGMGALALLRRRRR